MQGVCQLLLPATAEDDARLHRRSPEQRGADNSFIILFFANKSHGINTLPVKVWILLYSDTLAGGGEGGVELQIS
jgi:hypothetical protein